MIQEAVPPAQLKAGDVVSFVSDRIPGAVLTHRVISTRQIATVWELRTQPLGEPEPDERTWIVPAAQPVGRTIYWVPLVGFIVGAVGGTPLTWGMIVLGAGLLWGFLRPAKRIPKTTPAAQA
jgi:hypothetical protein